MLGETIIQNEFKMTNDNQIKTTSVTKVFGAYKNKLIIQPLGIQTIGLLLTHFNGLFDYNYTSEMESELDKIEDSWENVLTKCDSSIRSCNDPLKRKMNKAYRIDEAHELVHGKSGAMIRVKGYNGYKPLKRGLKLDFEMLENEEYKLADVLEEELPCLGILHGEGVYIKNGPHGVYVQWGDKTTSIKCLTEDGHSMESITLEMVKVIIDKKEIKQTEKTKVILRELHEHMSVRKSKFGNYIYFKTDKMKSPIFVDIKNCPYDVLEEDKDILCEWAKMHLRPVK